MMVQNLGGSGSSAVPPPPPGRMMQLAVTHTWSSKGGGHYGLSQQCQLAAGGVCGGKGGCALGIVQHRISAATVVASSADGLMP